MLKSIIATILLTINPIQYEPINQTYIIEYGSPAKSVTMEIETNKTIEDMNNLILNSVFEEEDFTNGIFDNHQKLQSIQVDTPQGKFDLYLPDVLSIREK